MTSSSFTHIALACVAVALHVAACAAAEASGGKDTVPPLSLTPAPTPRASPVPTACQLACDETCAPLAGTGGLSFANCLVQCKSGCTPAPTPAVSPIPTPCQEACDERCHPHAGKGDLTFAHCLTACKAGCSAGVESAGKPEQRGKPGGEAGGWEAKHWAALLGGGAGAGAAALAVWFAVRAWRGGSEKRQPTEGEEEGGEAAQQGGPPLVEGEDAV